MSTAVTLATPEHLDPLLSLVEAFHAETGQRVNMERRRDGVRPLLDGSPHGAVYLMGPPRAPVGYLVISFGWSVAFGGLEGALDEIYVRPGVRGRGIATEVIEQLTLALKPAGLRALNLEVAGSDARLQNFYHRLGFGVRKDMRLMSRRL